MTDLPTTPTYKYSWYFVAEEREGVPPISVLDNTLRDFYVAITASRKDSAKDDITGKYCCFWGLIGEPITKEAYDALPSQDVKDTYKEHEEDGKTVYYLKENVFTIVTGYEDEVFSKVTKASDRNLYYSRGVLPFKKDGNTSRGATAYELLQNASYVTIQYSGTDAVRFNSATDSKEGTTLVPYANYPNKMSEGEVPLHVFVWALEWTKKIDGDGKEKDVFKEHGPFYYEPSDVVPWTVSNRMGVFIDNSIVRGKRVFGQILPEETTTKTDNTNNN